MEEVSKYLKDLDLSVLRHNKPTLKVVNDTIRPYITQLSNMKQTTDKIQEILEMTDPCDLLEIVKKIKIENMIFNACGSKILEIFIKKKCGHILKIFIKKNIKKVLNDDCGTFVLRKVIENNFYFGIKIDDIDFEKESVLTTINVFINHNYDFEAKEPLKKRSKLDLKIEENILLNVADQDIATVEQLDEKIIARTERCKETLKSHIIEKYFNLEYLQAKKYSHFLENFIKCLNQKEISRVYKKIESSITILSECPFGNFILQSFIGKYDKVDELRCKIDLSTVHENILIRFLLKYQELKKDAIVEELIIQHYNNLESFLFIGDCFNKKCLSVVRRLFIMEKHNLNINEVFTKRFTSKALKGNIECIRLYLLGNDSPENKERFVKRHLDDCWSKKGEQILVWMSRVCAFTTRNKILQILRKKKKKALINQ